METTAAGDHYIGAMIRRTVLACSVLVGTVVSTTTPAAHAASVGAGACVSTVDDATGVTSTVAADGACVVTFATASTSPTTSAQYATRTWTVPAGITSVDVLVVAGGGGGGSSNGCCYDAGAGGGGGVVVATNFAVTPASNLTVLTGQGGRGTYCGNGYDGGRSQFGSLLAIGGGRGGGCSVSVGSGGSGGGAHCYSSAGSSTQASGGTPSNGSNIVSYGRAGGLSTGCSTGGGGGGGGATAVGAAGTGDGSSGPSGGVGGNGGEGIANSLRTDSAIVYGSGGGGQGRWTNGLGGTNAGDGSGTNAAGGTGIDGVDETGGGGGAGWRSGTVGNAAGDGGSGVVVVRYLVNTAPANSVAPSISGTTTNGQTLTGARGTWSGYPAPTYTYRWKRSSTVGGSYTNITGATSLSYTLTDDDIDMYLKFEVTATNSTSTTVELSAATARVADFVRPTTTTTSTTTTTIAAPATTAPALIVNVSAPTTTFVTIPSATESTAVPVIRSTATTTPTGRTPSATTTTSPSTTVPNAPTTTSVPAPQPATVVNGQAAMTVGDTSITPTVERRDNKLVITAGDYTASLGAVDSDGKVAPLDPNGNIRLSTGQKVQVNASGFEPDTIVEIWLFSSPVKLGEMTVDKTGTVSGTFEIPAGTPAGNHRMVILARGENADEATLTIGLAVGEWKKSKNIATWLIVLPIVLAVIGALTLPATRRRRRRMSAAS